MIDDNHNGNFLSGVILGALVGAGVVWFLNQTKEGKKVKAQIKEKSEDVIDNLADLIEDIEEKGEEFKKRVAHVQKELEEKAQDMRKEVVEKAQEGIAKIELLQERGRKAAKFFLRHGKPLN